jgi:acyl-CoA thioesterase
VRDAGPPLTFADASAVNAVGDGAWEGVVPEGWDIVGNVNGGYLLAMAARAAGEAAGRATPVTVTGHFLAPGKPGPVTVRPAALKEGRRLSTVAAVLEADRPLVAMLGTFAGTGDEGVPFERVEGTPPDLPRPDECIRVEPTDTFPPPFVGRIDLRLHPDHSEFGSGDSSRVRGWVRLLDGEPIDELAMLMIADSFPPAVFFSDAPVAWVPTVELTVHVRERPTPGWLRCIFTTRFVTAGMLEEDGEMWDESGRLVALSRQLALVPRT